MCDGAAVSRSTYANLYTAIGTTFGSGDGANTFNLPDFRGRAPIGSGTGSGLSARTLGASGGTETHQLTESEMPAHTHTYTETVSGNGATGATSSGVNSIHTASGTTGSKGSDAAHNNMSPYLVINFIIKI